MYGTLQDLIMKKLRFNSMQIKFMMIQLLLTADSIHGRGFIHRDIKLENILVNNHVDGFL